MPWATAGVSTALTVAGTFLSPNSPEMPLWIPIGNRLFTIMVIWVLAWFAVKRREAETALQKVNEGLEEKVAERTRELAGVNQALVSEITERMQAEQAFRISQGRLAGILDIAEDAIIVMEEDRSIALFNQGAVKLFGYEPDEVLGDSIDRLLPERHRADHAAYVSSFADAGDLRQMPQRLDRRKPRSRGSRSARRRPSPSSCGT
jgi:PAS domain S-box-containing protein